MTMYTTGYGLFLSEGQYEEKSHTFIGFSLNKEELEEKIQKLEREFEVFKIEFESQSINIDTYISKFNNDWTKFASQNVNPYFKFIQITYGTELRKIFIGSCPHFFVVEMNDSF